MKKKNILSRTPVVLLLVFVCCFLWGSAFPSIKIGYQIFRIGRADTGGQILFGGIRFVLAGILVIFGGSLAERRILLPARGSWVWIGLLTLVQTVGQYVFFYVGLAHSSGVKASVIVASSTFFSLLVAALVFRTERLTAKKVAGCLLGFAGVVLIQLQGSSLGGGLSLLGEGSVLFSSLMSAFSSSIIKKAGQKENPVLISGYQFLVGGIIMILGALVSGGRIISGSGTGCLLLLYLALISAVAYTLWSLLLQYHPVSRIAVFGFLNPIIGLVLSGLFLGEGDQAFRPHSLVALLLVSMGIVVVYYRRETSAGHRGQDRTILTDP